MSEENEKQTPEHKIRVGNVTATVWKNIHKKDNKEFETFSITVLKNYKDGEEWKTSNSFQLNDLPKLEVVSRKAFEYIMVKSE